MTQPELRGNFTQGGLVMGKTQPVNRVYLDNRKLPLSSEGKFIFGFGRDAPNTAILKIRTPEGETKTSTLTITKRAYQTQYIHGLKPHHISPEPKHWPRIRAEARMVRNAREVNSTMRSFTDPFIWPLHGIVTGVYGSQRILNGKPSRPHYGIDISCPMHTPVRAPADGEVVLSENDLFFSGGTIIISHGHGLSSSFLHIEKLQVSLGDHIKQGEVIGEVGATGRATGPHLDWRMNWFEKRLDPMLLVRAMPTQDCASNLHSKEKPPTLQKSQALSPVAN